MKLLTWNIQAGIGTRRYRDYLLHAHRQLIHTPAKTLALHDIAGQISPYDLVCLQEIDLGGRRSGFRSQIETIAALSGHAHVAVQLNRVVPGISRHGNAILSHWPLHMVEDLKLPGLVAGRGCLIVDVAGPVALRLACLHLSLGAAAQRAQLAAVAKAMGHGPRWLAMGDFNCRAASAPLRMFCAQTGAALPARATPTYPSWRPRRDYDHILASADLLISDYQAQPVHLSDHLPVTARITLNGDA
ncbi:MAG: endonuclease/exonuclease/phosphatase family protein [Sphingomonadales bacterium]|nr:endonuclease/exonuclease/phosphatase family protein [Sphingomonadales bacterium]MDE2172127.1 endonuclease/exonuclease/phosphatase family protein [Sphingomonadales bacterium]